MNSKALITSFLVLAVCSYTFGQKIKYKDLFVLLNAKQYPEAEPFLKKYLKDNDDNPNAYLFMGFIYQEKAAKSDMLKQTQQMIHCLDSAVHFYSLAYKGITEKELNRNEEYYQMYNRRDLRTGKFGVTLSDVQLDLETRMKLKERSKLLLTLKTQFILADAFYQKAQKLFLNIQGSYPGIKELYLRADDNLINDLTRLAQLYDSCHISFNDYKSTMESIGKTSYNQDLDPQEITDFKKDGVSPADFYQDDLKIWDYKRWALSSEEIIQKDVTPLKEQLIAFDGALNQLHQKLKKDSVSVRAELAELRKKDFSPLLKIDPKPLPVMVFAMKANELEYGSQIIEDKALKDSLNATLHADAVRKELSYVRKVDSLSASLTGPTFDEGVLNYNHYVSAAYGTQTVLNSLISATHDFAKREVTKKEAELKRRNEGLRWIVNGADSIPLFNEVSASSKFRPLLLKENNFTAGLQFADSLATGYFYLISPSRKPEVKAAYPVDQKVFRKRNLPFVKAASTQDEKGQVFFVVFFSEAKMDEKYKATIAKIYRTDGLAWSINYSFDQLPEELAFTLDTAELSVKTRNAAGELLVVVFDRTGKMVH